MSVWHNKEWCFVDEVLMVWCYSNRPHLRKLHITRCEDFGRLKLPSLVRDAAVALLRCTDRHAQVRAAPLLQVSAF